LSRKKAKKKKEYRKANMQLAFKKFEINNFAFLKDMFSSLPNPCSILSILYSFLFFYQKSLLHQS
jgi:hypothetical protein